MGMQMKGTVHLIRETKQVSEKFSKREFVVVVADNPKYPQHILFEATGDRIGQLDSIGVGDEVAIDFNIRGREWRSPSGEVKYFTTLDVWKVAKTGATATSGTGPAASRAATSEPTAGSVEDLPF